MPKVIVERGGLSGREFPFDRGLFLADYEEVLGKGLPSLYHVEDTWENYERLRERIDSRYAAWRAKDGRRAGRR